jgi:hypothetical protein
MISLREATAVLGLGGNFSVVNDFFRFLNGVPDKDISFRNHVSGMLGPHININIVRVSAENFTGTDIDTIDIGIQDVRDIYNQVGVGVNVDHFVVEGADADGFRVITKVQTAKKLFKTFRGPGNRNIDAFLVLVVQTADPSALAFTAAPDSPTECKDKSKVGQRGLVVGMNLALYGFQGPLSPGMRARTRFGFALAHEIGHMLIGPDHVSDWDNLMSAGVGTRDDLTEGQGNAIRSRCAVVEG